MSVTLVTSKLKVAGPEGRAAEVENAIRQDRVWYPELGGAEWESKLSELYQRAAAKLPEGAAASRPETSSSPAEPTGP